MMLLAIGENKLGNSEESMKAVGLYLDEEQSLEGLLYRSKLNLKRRKYENAIEDLDQILVLYPKHCVSFLLKVRCLIAEKSFDKALENIQIGKDSLDEADYLQQLSV